MRVTHGEVVRRFVYGLRVGSVPAVRAMHGRQQVWPSNELRVKRLAIDLSGLAGTAEEIFWGHALDAVSVSATGTRFVGFNIAGREYRLGSTYGAFPLARLSMGWLDFGDDGPLAEDVRVGDVLRVEARVGARASDWFTQVERAVCGLSYLPGTRLEVQFVKGKKREQAGCEFEVRGVNGGVVHFGGACLVDAHRRGVYVRSLPEYGHTWIDAVYDDVLVPGEGGLLVTARLRDLWRSTEVPAVRLLWPGFNMFFEFPVTVVEL